jgi:hypothetical protein
MASGYDLPVFTEGTAGNGQGRGARTSHDGRRETIRLRPRALEIVDMVVKPSAEETLIRFERYADLSAAILAAEGDPDATVRKTRDGLGVVIRTPGGVNCCDAVAGTG